MVFELSIGDVGFGVALAFLFGIFAASLAWNFAIIFLVAVFAAATLSFFAAKQFWKASLLFLLALLAGAFYYHFYLSNKAAHTKLPIGTSTSFSAIVTDEPQPSEKYLILTAEAQPPLQGAVEILAPPGSEFSYGDLLKISGTINKPDSATDDPILFSPKITLLAKHRGFFLREWMINVKLAILDKFNEILPADEAALLGGITFGSKQDFKPELKQAMALSGLTHLVAISGYNITIVIFAVGQIFGRFFSRRTTFIFGIIFLLLFMFMVGGAASGVRAAIMGFLALVAKEMGENFSIRNAVTFTAVIMAILDPTVLTQNMSFVLSFVSLLGIVYLQPPLKQLFRQTEKGAFDWKENALTTLSAQLAVMPVLVNTFGQFSATAIIANILVLGTVPLTMFLGFLLALLGFASRYLAFFTGQLTGLMLGYQLSVIRLFAKLAVPLPLSFNAEFVMFFYYLMLVTFVIFYTGDNHDQEI